MEIERLAKKLYEGYVKKPIRNTLVAGITAGCIGLGVLTSLEDNVHFVPVGTIEILNPSKNQYVYGIMPMVDIGGRSDKNIHTIGLFPNNSLQDSSTIGNMNVYGLFKPSNGIYCGVDNCSVNDMNAYGLFLTSNHVLGNNSYVKDMNVYGLLDATNSVGKDNSHTIIHKELIWGSFNINVQNMNAHGLEVYNSIKGNRTKINGKINPRGLN